MGRLLIVEASDNDWKSDNMPDGYSDLLGVKTKLQILQSEHSDLDCRGYPTIRVLRVSNSTTGPDILNL